MVHPSCIHGCHCRKGARQHWQALLQWICFAWYQIVFVTKESFLRDLCSWRIRQAQPCSLLHCLQLWSVWPKILPGMDLGSDMAGWLNNPLSNTLAASGSRAKTPNIHAEVTFWHLLVKPCACTRSCPSSQHQTGQSPSWLQRSSLVSKCLLLLVIKVGADQDRCLKMKIISSFCRVDTRAPHFVVRWCAMGRYMASFFVMFMMLDDVWCLC